MGKVKNNFSANQDTQPIDSLPSSPSHSVTLFGTDYGRRTEEKSKSIPSVKGPQELAKKASYQARAVGNSVFDWDDNCEDEGGGDICLRRRDEIFGVASRARRSSSTLLDKRKVHSDSRLLHRRGGKVIQAATKNLGKELDAVSDEHNKKISDMHDLVALGYDSQVAAEAVCFGGPRKVDACLTGKKLSPGEERGFCNGGVVTRQSKGTKRIHAIGREELLKRRMKKASPSPSKPCRKRRKVHTASRETKKNLVNELDKVSKDSNTRMFDRCGEEEAGPDTQMAAEAIKDLHSGEAREGVISSSGVVTRKSKRLKGIQAVDNDVEPLKQKNKKAKSIPAKACDRIEKLEAVVSSTEKSGGEAEALSYTKRRRSARISQDEDNEAGRSSDPTFDTPVKSKVPSKTGPSKAPSKNVSPICMGDEYHRLTCKASRTSNTTNEFRNLTLPLMEPIPETKSTRKRRDLGKMV